MQGVGEPALILRPGASPHHEALRPSQARALASAEVVFWIGEALTPWLKGGLRSLAPRARVVTLLDLPGTVIHRFRETALFGPGAQEAQGAADTGAHGDEPGLDRHEPDPGPVQQAGGIDPHAWLDPGNAELWLVAMAETLADADPANGALYRANAARGRARIAAVTARIEARLAPLREKRFVAFHDAWQYFERRFGLHAAGAIRLGDATPPGPARLAALRAALAEQGVSCVIAEPQFDPGLIEAVSGGRRLRVARIDPLGTGLAPGPELYPAMLEAIGEAVADCLGGP